MMKSLGQNPSAEELKAMILEVDEEGSDTIEFPECLVMKKKMKESENPLRMLRKHLPCLIRMEMGENCTS